jgi:hypothetical protein
MGFKIFGKIKNLTPPLGYGKMTPHFNNFG